MTSMFNHEPLTLEKFEAMSEPEREKCFLKTVRKGRVQEAEIILEKYPKAVHWRPNNHPLLQIAMERGHLKMFKLLLDKGADINTRIWKNERLVLRAVTNQQKDFIDVLIQRHADLVTPGDCHQWNGSNRGAYLSNCGVSTPVKLAKYLAKRETWPFTKGRDKYLEIANTLEAAINGKCPFAQRPTPPKDRALNL